MTQEKNPYRPPTAEVEHASEAVDEREPAGKGRRFATLVIDYIGYYIASFLVGIAIYAIAGHAVPGVLKGGWSYLFGFTLIMAYYLIFEGLWQRTPGKMLLVTRVVDEHGAPPTFGAIVKRTLARCVPFEAFTFFGEHGFHDKVSRTRVVRTR